MLSSVSKPDSGSETIRMRIRQKALKQKSLRLPTRKSSRRAWRAGTEPLRTAAQRSQWRGP
jgi:hypothetical protein